MRQQWNDDRIEQELRTLRSDMDLRFERVDARFDGIDEKLERIDERFERIDEKFDVIDKRLEKFDSRFEQVDLRFDALHRVMIQFCTATLALIGIMIAAILGIALS